MLAAPWMIMKGWAARCVVSLSVSMSELPLGLLGRRMVCEDWELWVPVREDLSLSLSLSISSLLITKISLTSILYFYLYFFIKSISFQLAENEKKFKIFFFYLLSNSTKQQSLVYMESIITIITSNASLSPQQGCFLYQLFRTLLILWFIPTNHNPFDQWL